MNKTQKSFFAFTLLACVGQVSAECAVTSLYSPRSQGVNAARDMVGWEELINLCDKECFYGAGKITFEYSQTFRPNRICECLFGVPQAASASSSSSTCSTSCESDCNDCVINIKGSCVEGRNNATDWVADYFGLPVDFQSSISFKPRIQNFVADIQFYLGLAEWCQGLYFRLDLPIVHTKWRLNACETVSADAAFIGNYPVGYFSAQAVPVSQLLTKASDFFAGSVPSFTDADPAITFQPLKYGKWACDSRSKTGLADVLMVLGYNFVCNDCGFFGLNLRAAAPTGTRPKGEFLFEPIVGNGRHWTLGVGMNAHYVFWRSSCNNSMFGFYLDANITHLFKACQTRSFDLCAQGANSRYMLAQRLEAATTLYGNPGTPPQTVAGSTQSTLQFANEYAPVANLTGSSVDVKVSVEGDVALKFAFSSDCGLNWDIGYNFWGRACEDVCPTKCSNVDLSKWALKGDAYVYGFRADNDAAVALAATESKATISSGQGGGTGVTLCNNNLNAGIDNRQLAYFNNAGTLVAVTSAGDVQTATSIQAITLDKSSVNYSSNRGISHKVFTNLSYTWKECEDWMPFIGIGVSAEFGQSCSKGCNDSCDTACNTSCNTSCNTGCNTDSDGSCVSCALNQWSVWFQGGVAFN